jgi:hypothetical protein
MTVLSAGSFAGSGVAHGPKHPTVGSAGPSQKASRILRNPDFGAVRGVKTHIISGIRRQCCRPARSHTRSRAGKGKPDASPAPTPGFCRLCFSFVFKCRVLQRSLCPAFRRRRMRRPAISPAPRQSNVRRRYSFNSHFNASSTFVNTRRSTHRFCATVSRKQCESHCPGLQMDATLHLCCSKTRVLFPNS